MRRAIACAVLGLWLALSGAAQPRTSSISGTVRDASGAVVEGAVIRVRNLETGLVRTTVSDATGAFRVPALEVGPYEVSAEKTGFARSRVGGVILELDREAIVEPVLEIGERSDSVTVEVEARLVEATTSTLSAIVDSTTIEKLPLNGRDWVQLATLQAGAPVARAQYRTVNTGFGLQISLSGSRPSQNNFQLDGISLTAYSGSTPGSANGGNLGLDAVREFSVLTSTYSAQYGRAAGGVIHAATRSGGNEVRGNAFYFHRNDNLDARNFFDGPEPPEYRRHQFGGSLGGPLARNRTFYFSSYEALRELRGRTTIDTTLSPAARRGELTSGRVAVDPAVAKIVSLYPEPNGPVLGDTGLFIYPDNELGRQDFFTSRIDYNVADHDRLFFRYTLDDGARSEQTAFALGRSRTATRWQSAVAEHTHILSPAVLNTARFGFMRAFTDSGRTVTETPGTDDPALAFVPGGRVAGIIVVTGLTEFPGGSGAPDADLHAFSSFQAFDDLTWIRGRHTVKVGAWIERIRYNTDSRSTASGEFRFRNLSEFLRNLPDRFQAQLPGSDTVRGHRQWVAAWYVQNSWRIGSRWTADAGLRHEWASVPGEVNGKIANLDKLTDASLRLGGPLFENPSLKNFSPRLGLAWDVRGGGRTVLRGGWGLFPDLILAHFILLSGVRNPPFFLRGAVRGLPQGAFPKGGYPALVAGGTPEYRLERLDPRPDQPRVQQWNITLEQALPADLSLRLAYVGSRGRNLSSFTEDANLVEPVTLPDGRLYFPAEARKLNPNFSQIRNRTFDAESFYNALQAQLRRRFDRGFQFQIGYTFSKSIDDSSTFFGVNESDNAMPLPLNGNPRFNRGLSGHDVRHYVVGSGVWEIPGPRQGPARRWLAGWQVNLIATYASGLPFSARLGYDAARTKTTRPDFRSGQRPDLAPGASPNPVTKDPMRWVDLSAFRRPQEGFLGNLGRNTIIGPDLANVDFSLTRRVTLREKAALDLRFEFFNLLNRTNFHLPSPERMEVFGAAGTREDVARITSAAPSREIQLGLKLRF
ncbi:MAG TPA: TonB-dependent receptor [Bryobacteraceae bacterium]|nr:TonB-dependent receptor [Bryobacteraceae bacterium]